MIIQISSGFFIIFIFSEKSKLKNRILQKRVLFYCNFFYYKIFSFILFVDNFLIVNLDFLLSSLLLLIME